MPKNKRKAISKARKNAKKPKYDTNWCNLPVEMRLKCIQEMDLKSKTRLRQTAKLEKSLVDSHKHRFKELRIEDHKFYWKIWADNDIRMGSGCLDYAKKTEVVKKILENCEFSTFSWGNPYAKEFGETFFMDEVCKILFFSKVSLEKINIKSCNGSTYWSLLRCCQSAGRVFFDGEFAKKFDFEDILNLPVMIKCLDIRIKTIHSTRFLHNIVENWTRIDVEIGKCAQLIFKRNVYETFLQEVEETVISKIAEFAVLRHPTAEKRILLHNIGTDSFRNQYISVKMIDSKLKKNQYLDGSDWLKKKLKSFSMGNLGLRDEESDSESDSDDSDISDEEFDDGESDSDVDHDNLNFEQSDDDNDISILSDDYDD